MPSSWTVHDEHTPSTQEVVVVVKELQRFLKDESGPELVEWAVVTVILILATYAILQSIGSELKNIYTTILETLKNIQGG